MVEFNDRRGSGVVSIPGKSYGWEGNRDANGELDEPCGTFVPMDQGENVDVCANCMYHRIDHEEKETRNGR